MRSLEPEHDVHPLSTDQLVGVVRHVSGVDQRVVLDCLDGRHLVEDHLVALRAVQQAEVDRVDAVVSVQAESFVAGVVCDCKGGKQLRLGPLELQVLEVQAVVLIEWFP